MAPTSPIQTQGGLLLLDKPSGPTSYDMIRWIKRTIKNTKIGHCGTLDPLASGLLIILLGKATKKQSLIMGQDKTYLTRMRFGVRTDTGDTTGTLVEEKPVPPLTQEMVEKVLATFVGDQKQMPPMYSALKHKGTPLYDLARQGKTIEREERQIKIHSLDFLRFINENEIEVRLQCSSGTYVRVLAEDVGQRLNTCGTMSALIREAIGSYSLAQAVSGDELKGFPEDKIWACVKPVA
jgi:tRNA pseudouridine55 synthase